MSDLLKSGFKETEEPKTPETQKNTENFRPVDGSEYSKPASEFKPPDQPILIEVPEEDRDIILPDGPVDITIVETPDGPVVITKPRPDLKPGPPIVMPNPIEKTDFQSKRMDIMPRTGDWSGIPGNSVWKPNKDDVPQNTLTNPDQLSWADLLEKYQIDGIPFKDGYPDFSDVSKGQVEIEDFSDNRPSNFAQADEALAKQKGCSPEEVKKWREENGYTWHECEDCKTMQKVPREIHGNVPHEGGISVYKSQHTDN